MEESTRAYRNAGSKMKISPFAQRGQTPHAAECMAKIRELMANPRRSGNWWAREVMSKVAAGEIVNVANYDLAKAALRTVTDHEPGQDDEETTA